MDLALFKVEGVLYFLRWMHYFFGVAWIGLLYYFNFVQTPFMADAGTDASTKSSLTRGLLPRALNWFRWAALFTFLTGFIIFSIRGHMSPGSLKTAWGAGIITGMALGIVMFLNVWLIIWPNQKVVMANAHAVASGQPANPNVAVHAGKAALASRSNVLFSIPMLFFMGAGRHMPFNQSPTNLAAYFLIFVLILGALEFNAIKGKMGPMKSVAGVIHAGLGLWLVLYLLFEFVAGA